MLTEYFVFPPPDILKHLNTIFRRTTVMKQTIRKVIAIVLTVAMIQGTGGFFSFAATSDVTQPANGAQSKATVEEPAMTTGDPMVESPGIESESAEGTAQKEEAEAKAEAAPEQAAKTTSQVTAKKSAKRGNLLKAGASDALDISVNLYDFDDEDTIAFPNDISFFTSPSVAFPSFLALSSLAATV